MEPDAMILVFWMLSLGQLFHCLLLPSSISSLVLLRFLPLEWYHLYIWGCWYFSRQSWLHKTILQITSNQQKLEGTKKVPLCPTAFQGWGGVGGMLLPMSWLQTCSLQNRAGRNFCFKHPVCGSLFQQPQTPIHCFVFSPLAAWIRVLTTLWFHFISNGSIASIFIHYLPSPHILKLWFTREMQNVIK